MQNITNTREQWPLVVRFSAHHCTGWLSSAVNELAPVFRIFPQHHRSTNSRWVDSLGLTNSDKAWVWVWVRVSNIFVSLSSSKFVRRKFLWVRVQVWASPRCKRYFLNKSEWALLFFFADIRLAFLKIAQTAQSDLISVLLRTVKLIKACPICRL